MGSEIFSAVAWSELQRNDLGFNNTYRARSGRVSREKTGRSDAISRDSMAISRNRWQIQGMIWETAEARDFKLS
jgi:hypothetical protein